MKKVIMLLLAGATAMLFIGCSQEDTKADLKWANGTGITVSEIKWKDSSTNVNQTWSGSTSPQTETGFKGITELSGSGECVDDAGDDSIIVLDTTTSEGVDQISSNSATIKENAAAKLVISAAKKK